jgi:isocitrate dehydrogenase (NAD+)
MTTITLFAGDGIGPEISAAVSRIIQSVCPDITFEPCEIGQTAYEHTGELIPQSAIDSLEKNRIALKGPCTTPVGKGFRSVNVQLRTRFDLYQNIRPAKSLPSVSTRFSDVNLVVFRENTEDLYIGEEIMISPDEAHAVKKITRTASERIIRAAFEYARSHSRKRVTCVHKANILKLTDGLFLHIFQEIAPQYPDLTADSRIVDNMCMQLVIDPEDYDVLVMPNLYGDILSDLVSGLIGGLGVMPSAQIGSKYAVFEAVHGSAPDIAGKGIANPTALLLSACMMLDYMGRPDHAQAIRAAVNTVLADTDSRTRDLGGQASTEAYTQALLRALKTIQ